MPVRPHHGSSLAGRLPLVLAIALGAGGCSVDNRTLRVADGGVTQDEITAGVAFCVSEVEAEAACNTTAPEAVAVTLDDVGVCKPVPSLLQSGQISFDPTAGAACSADLKADPCMLMAQTVADCSGVYRGIITVGGQCYPGLSWNPCQPGSHCVTTSHCPGSCVAYRQLGQSCDQTVDDSDSCEPPLICDGVACISEGPTLLPPGPSTLPPPSSTPSETLGLAALGQPCSPGAFECGGGMYCGPVGVCILLPSVGDSCAGNAGEGTSCLNGYCAPGSAICAAFLQAGDSCQGLTNLLTGADACGGFWQICDPGTGFCVPTCQAGNACGLRGQTCCLGEECEAGATCVEGTCLACGAGQAC